ETLAFLTDEIFNRDPDVVEENGRVRCATKAHLALVPPKGDSRHILRFDDEGADTVGAGTIARPRHHDDIVGRHAVAAPLLAAVEDVAIAVFPGAGVDRGHVGAGLRLGNGYRGYDAAFRDYGQVFLPLLFGAEVKQRHDEHGVQRGNRRAGRGEPRDLLPCDAGHGQIAVRPAILLGDPELHQSHLAEELHELQGKAIGLIDFGCDRRHVLVGHLPDVFTKGDLLLGEAHGRLRWFFRWEAKKGASIEWVIHLIIHRMSTKSSPQAPASPRTASPKRRSRTSDHRAVGSPAPLSFRPIHTRRAFEEICERIREQLALGVLKPGDKLPPERDLAQQLGVSRNVLREALRSLEMAGVLRLQKGVKGGAFVQHGDTSRMNVVMRDMLSLGTISIRELSEARVHVLDLVVRLACVNARQSDFDALQANVERTELFTREGRLLERVECAREFYKLLAVACGNKVIAMITDAVTEIHMRFVYAKVASSGVAMARLGERRRQFLAALRERNAAAAARLMRNHLGAVQKMLEQDPGAMSLQVALAEMKPGMRR